MQYHIQTTPIWDAFKKPCDCPMCELSTKVEGDLVLLYLGEAVMEPDYRIRVNKYGFCTKHLVSLYRGENKLGLSLQLSTRFMEIHKGLKTVDNVKSAEKEADRIKKTLESCVICNEADEIMRRYAYTVAQMYGGEPDFPAVLSKVGGFCMPHYALLLSNAKRAGKAAPAYLKELSRIQAKSVQLITGELEGFAAQFDYRAGRTSQGEKNALPKAINKLKGRTVESVSKD